MQHRLEKLFHKAINKYHAFHPRRTPSIKELKNCKIISHRGEHDNKKILENTLPAFDEVLTAGVWGIEFDIRWTKDLVPMVFHDKNLKRLFKADIELNNITYQALNKQFPIIPTLEEIINHYGKKLHLMVEIKKEDYPEPEQQTQILKKLFKDLTPVDDYHFITIHPDMFQFINFVPSEAFMPIAIISYKKQSRISVRKKYGGVLGHYQFLTKGRIKGHKKRGHTIGVGFVASKNSLFRELNRGVEWIFSDHAVKMQKVLDEMIARKQA